MWALKVRKGIQALKGHKVTMVTMEIKDLLARQAQKVLTVLQDQKAQ